MFYSSGIPPSEGRGFDLSSLPQTETVKAKPSRGFFMIVLGSLFSGVFALAAVGIAREVTLGWLVLILALPGVYIVVKGILELFSKKLISLGEKYIEVTEHTLFGEKRWQEPISEYSGILNEPEFHSTGSERNRKQIKVLTIKLLHENPARTIKLFETLTEDGHRRKWEQTANLFELPAIEKIDGNIVSRDSEDLDKNVSELIKEGKIILDSEKLDAIPEGFDITEANEQWSVVYKMKLKWIVYLVVLIALGFLGYFGFATNKMPIAFGYVSCGIALIIIVVAVLNNITVYRIIITKDQLLYQNIVFGKVLLNQSIYISEVEEIRVGTSQTSNVKGILLKSDRKELHFGTGLNEKSLSWLQSLILSKF